MDKKLVLVVGGASGMGRAVVEYFLASGWLVVSADKAYSEIKQTVAGYYQIPCDISNCQLVNSLIEYIEKHIGIPEVVINSAGTGCVGRIESIPSADIDTYISINIKGIIYLLQLTLPLLRKAEKGRFIQVSSIAGQVAYPLSSIYNACRYAIEGLFESLRFELISDTVSAHIFRPGYIDSQFSDHIVEYANNLTSEQKAIKSVRKNFVRGVKSTVSCEEVARQIYLLATQPNPPFSQSSDRVSEYILKQRKKMTEDEWFDSVSKQFNL
jgi:NAD(P)-dependent dehydrogenase (short-subunit alcohol dehydrogenase family)